jgi:hypothetical protein
MQLFKDQISLTKVGFVKEKIRYLGYNKEIMKGLRFTLLQLLVCIGIVLFIAFVIIIRPQPHSTQVAQPQDPVPTVPFMNIKMK